MHDLSPLASSKGFQRIISNDSISDPMAQFQANLLAAADEMIARCIKEGTLEEHGFTAVAAALT